MVPPAAGSPGGTICTPGPRYITVGEKPDDPFGEEGLIVREKEPGEDELYENEGDIGSGYRDLGTTLLKEAALIGVGLTPAGIAMDF